MVLWVGYCLAKIKLFLLFISTSFVVLLYNNNTIIIIIIIIIEFHHHYVLPIMNHLTGV